jgi:dCTP diphosphatase
MAKSLDVEAVAEFLRNFAEERDWTQYHTPKNLVMALSGEVGELMEIFQWLTPEESRRVMEDQGQAAEVEQELADVLQYLIRLADVLGLDLEEALWEKLRSNQRRFPIR